LHKPLTGHILIDGKELTEANIREWKGMIGYVPQQIFLTDASIAENIAFGMPRHEINMENVLKASQIANLHDFIVRDLPGQYDTIVGERGVRLSGGQKQRLGIARALYRDPAVLILDEATSALDNLTESYIIKALETVKGTCTVVIVAHRFSTIEKCDKIIVMKNGRIADQGKYGALLDSSAEFKKLSLID